MSEVMTNLSALNLDYFYYALTRETAVQIGAVVVLTWISTLLRAIWRFILAIIRAFLKALSRLFW